MKLHDYAIKSLPKSTLLVRYSLSGSCLSAALLLLVFFMAACSASHQAHRRSPGDPAAPYRSVQDGYLEKINVLGNDLAALNRQADMTEARQVAETAISYSSNLAAEYNLVRPAVLHNVFVRMGLKDRGLCYHWTEDLIKRLQLLDLKTYRLRWGVAYRGSELREHNSVVITARGEPFAMGMVLDPWRNSGDLYWALVQADPYPWQELPSDEW